MLNEWETFKSSDGDIGYFLNLDSYQAPLQDQAHRSLRTIKEMFEALQKLHQQLVGLQDSCRNFTKDVRLGQIVFGNHFYAKIIFADGLS